MKKPVFAFLSFNALLHKHCYELRINPSAIAAAGTNLLCRTNVYFRGHIVDFSVFINMQQRTDLGEEGFMCAVQLLVVVDG